MPEPKLIQPERPKDLPPIGLDDVFPFQCRRDLDCFTTCCQNVSIILTPYDVLRMRKALGIDSTEFLEKYTLPAFTKEQKLPLLLLRMAPETLRCPFVSDAGCAIYQGQIPGPAGCIRWDWRNRARLRRRSSRFIFCCKKNCVTDTDAGTRRPYVNGSMDKGWSSLRPWRPPSKN